MGANFCTCFISETVVGEGFLRDQPFSAMCSDLRIRVLQQYRPEPNLSQTARRFAILANAAAGFSTRSSVIARMFRPPREMPRSLNESVVAPDRAAGVGSGRRASDRCYARLRQRLAPPRLPRSLA